VFFHLAQLRADHLNENLILLEEAGLKLQQGGYSLGD
jgi:hypothetical protein